MVLRIVHWPFCLEEPGESIVIRHSDSSSEHVACKTCETLAWKFFQATSLHSSRAPMSNLQAVYRWCYMRPELCVLHKMWYLGHKFFQKWSKCLGLRTSNQHCTSRVLILKALDKLLIVSDSNMSLWKRFR